MDENFEDQLSGMMRYRTEPVAPFTAADVVSGARRRSRTRTLGVAGSALAVAAVGVGVVTAVGSGGSGGGTASPASGTPTVSAATSSSTATTSAAPSTSATTSTSVPAVSPVQHVASGEKIQVFGGYDGYTVTVTKTQKCVTETAEFMGAPKTYPDQTTCKDVSGANMAWDGKGNWLSVQSAGFKSLTIVSGTFQGAQDPSLIEVVQDGKHYTATIVKADGMKNWAAYYIAFPASTAKRDISSYPLGFTVAAYDAAGNQLTQDPPAGWHPNVVTPTK